MYKNAPCFVNITLIFIFPNINPLSKYTVITGMQILEYTAKIKLPSMTSKKNIVANDKERIALFKRHGIQVYVIWESDIYDDLDSHMEQILRQVKIPNDYTLGSSIEDEDIV